MGCLGGEGGLGVLEKAELEQGGLMGAGSGGQGGLGVPVKRLS